MERYAVTQRERERQAIVGSINPGGQLRNIIKLVILLYQRVEH